MLLVLNVEIFVQNENRTLRFGIFFKAISAERKSHQTRIGIAKTPHYQQQRPPF